MKNRDPFMERFVPETRKEPHLEEHNSSVLSPLRLLFNLLLKVEHLPFQVPTNSLEVECGRRFSWHKIFRFIGKYMKIVPVLKSGIPAPPQKNQKSQRHPWKGLVIWARSLWRCPQSLGLWKAGPCLPQANYMLWSWGRIQGFDDLRWIECLGTLRSYWPPFI